MQLSRRNVRFEAKLDALVGVIGALDDGRTLNVKEVFLMERALIQLQIDWELFVRGVILDSATGKFCDSKGVIISSISGNLRSREHAGNHLITLYAKRRHEPDWYLPVDAVNAARLLNVSNLSTISAELGVTPWLLDELRYLRNFIAHRSKRAALNLRSAGLAATALDSVKIAVSYGSGGAKNYQGWTNFMKYVSRRIVL